MTQTQKLPDHPGDLIRLAVLDLVATAQDTKRFEVYMGSWFTPISNNRCAVCFAGAVLAQSLKAPMDKILFPALFDNDTDGKLTALDEFRGGYVNAAYAALGRKRPPSLSRYVEVTDWDWDEGRFLADMLDLAAMIDDAEANTPSTPQ